METNTYAKTPGEDTTTFSTRTLPDWYETGKTNYIASQLWSAIQTVESIGTEQGFTETIRLCKLAKTHLEASVLFLNKAASRAHL